MNKIKTTHLVRKEHPLFLKGHIGATQSANIEQIVSVLVSRSCNNRFIIFKYFQI